MKLPGDDIGALFATLFSPGVVKCAGCGQKNRTQPGRPNPRCGSCGLPLKVKTK